MEPKSKEARVQLKLDGEYSAADLEELIQHLAKMRAAMLPAVPNEPPTSFDTDALQDVDPMYRIRSLVGGGVRIWLRNEGYGWLPFTLSATGISKLAQFLGKPVKGH
jgi:hypothetical protein